MKLFRQSISLKTAKLALKPYILEDLKLKGFDPQSDKLKKANVIITRANFGCGSSREHAVWVFEVNDINVVIAESFARIFRQNMFNCGMLAVELDPQRVEEIFDTFGDRPTRIDTDLENGLFRIHSGETHLEIPFSISEFDHELVKAGGWVEYADQNY